MNNVSIITLEKLFEMVLEKEERKAIQSSSLDDSHTANNCEVYKNKLLEDWYLN